MAQRFTAAITAQFQTGLSRRGETTWRVFEVPYSISSFVGRVIPWGTHGWLGKEIRTGPPAANRGITVPGTILSTNPELGLHKNVPPLLLSLS